MGRIDYLKTLETDLNQIKQKIGTYLNEIDKIYTYVNKKYQSYREIQFEDEINGKIYILDKRCNEIIENCINIQNNLLSMIGYSNREIEMLKKKTKRFVDEIIFSSNVMENTFVFNFLLTKNLKNFYSTIDTKTETIDDLINDENTISKNKKTSQIRLYF